MFSPKHSRKLNAFITKTAQFAQQTIRKSPNNSSVPQSQNIVVSPEVNSVNPNYESFFSQIANQRIKEWISHQVKTLQPNQIRLINGSEEENEELIAQMVAQGSLVKLKKFPNSYAAFSDPSDVARVEKQTFICSEKESDAGPTNNWKDPQEMMQILSDLFDGSMKGRTLYVIPFSMGPIGSPFSKLAIQLSDSPYVVISMRIMTRIGKQVWDILNKEQEDVDFVPCVHSVGAPLNPGQADVAWPCNPTKYIVHFPESRSIYSFGSGYGGNALLGKKCLSLRIASVIGRNEGWLAEHMLILAITNPEGVKKYIAAAFPSACGKTNLAMVTPTIPGWKVETLGDDIAWIRPGEDGRLYACNPENGFFGVAPGTSPTQNPNALKTLSENSIFTNVALTEDGGVWWEGLSKTTPPNLINWKLKKHTAEDGVAAHPNSRFTTPLSQCPIIDKDWESPRGVPLSAILFGGRRKTTVPLVMQSFDWNHGTFYGASISSEQTAAAEGVVGSLRHDPFAMLPFCGYNMGDYFNHWFSMKERSSNANLLPKIFFVNWFRCGRDGKFLWPGFGENSRVLKWIFQRTSGDCDAITSPIGYLPRIEDFDLPSGVTEESMKELFRVNADDWKHEVDCISEYMKQFGSKLPEEMKVQILNLRTRLNQM